MAYLLQRYLGNYVRGLNKEALKISVWQGHNYSHSNSSNCCFSINVTLPSPRAVQEGQLFFVLLFSGLDVEFGSCANP